MVSQLVRSPGVYFDRQVDKTSDKDIYSLQGDPEPGCLAGVRDRQARQRRRPHRPQAQADASPCCSRRWAGTTRRSSSGSASTSRCAPTLEKDHTAGQDEALLDIYRKLRPGEPPTRGVRAGAAGEPVLQAEALRPGQGRPLQGQQEARPGRCRSDQRHADRGRRRRHHRVPGPAARGRGRDDRPRRAPRIPVETDDIDHFGNRRLRTVGELIQNQVRRRPVPDGARRPGADDHPGRRGDHAADPDQHPARWSPRSRSSSAPASCRSSWTRPTRWPGLTHKRRLSRAGPGRPVAVSAPGFEVRDVHPQPLRPDVPDRDPGRPEHRPDRLAVGVRAGQPVRLHRDARTARSSTAWSPTRSTT